MTTRTRELPSVGAPIAPIMQHGQIVSFLWGVADLTRKFNEALNENPGEHFTPRDVVHLMADLMLAGEDERLHLTGRRGGVYLRPGGGRVRTTIFGFAPVFSVRVFPPPGGRPAAPYAG